MISKIYLILIVPMMLLSCAKINQQLDASVYVSKEKEIDAQMLYRGLLYGKLEQIQKHTSTVLYEEIKANPQLLEQAKATIPKKDFLSKEIDTVKSKRELLNLSRPKLEVIYHYIYPEAVVRFQVIYDQKTSKIIDYGLDKQGLIRVE